MDFHTIQFHPGPRISSIVLNRPPLNVINIEMMEELSAAWKEIEEVGSQIAVITGAGEKAFSAGADVADHVPEKVETMLEKFHGVIGRIYDSSCVTIAAIHGHTLGGGAELAIVCDFVIAADNTKIGQPEIQIGCYPPVAAAYLPRVVGLHKAAELVLMGEPVSAIEAERLGLVNKVVPRADLERAVDDWTSRLLSKSAAVLALAKKALREGAEHRFEKALKRSEEIYLEELTKTNDMKEGIRSYLEKRPPNWTNR